MKHLLVLVVFVVSWPCSHNPQEVEPDSCLHIGESQEIPAAQQFQPRYNPQELQLLALDTWDTQSHSDVDEDGNSL